MVDCMLAGFREDVLAVCCGNRTVLCGDPGAATCADPSASLYWDGAHFTEAANRYIAGGWLATASSARMHGLGLVAALGN